VLQVEQGSLYPALQRIEEHGWITSYWGTSESNRRARFYKLTPKGKRQLAAESSRWEMLAQAVSRVMRPV
jgi:DNA-binding PadR family transcriptional regulator